ncbi:MAG: 16S rRNA (cytosine(967)-C(5))-methyltransferase [Candidatus Handelsmanbacteria bacterium RIFCSPLOWO2_12_FULL_64_10]|uniref:16S rRNA (cytosine(967)-C(5))-methyltransferase n=1 Tax=Handelsmanbacteria sp. (strain RIFCSPLOWO2_12_FULL_64_10) TaxID=1817868 RepID=A0A1F6CRB5_HANXR|nr:MAG: 16S rRNA (cytosine(967)-C(5))-methyltransferase [Candidatus Handelsmanbacteria bacterium RIFCSPLOWO2_12_FULL_64_10]
MALEALVRLETTGAYPKAVLNARLGASALTDADRNLARELVRGAVVWRGRIDYTLSRLLDRPLEGLPPPIRNALRIGAYQILFLEHIPAYAAVSESVRLARKHGHAGTAGLVNAVLRRVADRSADAVAEEMDPVDRLAILWSHPVWMVRRWVDRLGPQETESLCRANNRIPPVILRHNGLKGPLQTLLDRLCAEGVRVRPHPLQEGFLVVEEGWGLFRTPLFQEGWATVQDVSAGLAVCLLDPRPGETVLDLCAAPGGKTGFIAERMGDRGRVVALDRHAGRLRRLTENARRLGLRSVETAVLDASTFDAGGAFDRALVDAPCSGLGVLARRPDIRWRRGPSDLRELAQAQLQLLSRGAVSVRRGGVLVYSTCTTEPEENEGVVEAFLTAHSEFEVEPARDCVSSEVADHYVQTWSHRHDCDGAFAARLRRVR